MEKMLRIPLAVMVSVLSVFLVAGTASALPQCPACGGVVTQSCQLNADMVCPGPYGLIIGAAGTSCGDPLVIDGRGFALIGPGAAALNCTVLMDGGECAGHPCIKSAAGGCIPSGILNANSVTCGGGFNYVTVKDLAIEGWCDGIFMCGTCSAGPGEPDTYLQGITVDDCFIHDNGMACPTCVNDGIYLAVVGVPRVDDTSPTPIPGYTNESWCDYVPLHPSLCISEIKDNTIWNQKGRGCISCPGGSGINFNGGVEYDSGADITYSGCSKIHNNRVTKSSLSGIMLTHATMFNDIHKNCLKCNGYGGITIPCDYSDQNDITNNCMWDNYGCGIGVNCPQVIKKNLVQNSKKGSWDLGFPADGDGILVGPGKPWLTSAYTLFGNTSCLNAGLDMRDWGGISAILVKWNQCDTHSGTLSCDFACPDCCNKCKSDLNHDGSVDVLDLSVTSGEWGNLPDDCQPPWPGE